MAEEFSTKIEFLLEVFPNLSKEAITTRLNSAPSSERSTDALVAYFLAEEERKAEGQKNENTKANENQENTSNMEISKEANQNTIENSHFQENASTTHEEGDGHNEDGRDTANNSTSVRPSKYIIQDDDLDESVEVSPDPVEYSALTGRIEKTEEQLAQEEADMKLAQTLYEEELARTYAPQQSPQAQPYQSTYISPYDRPPTKRPESTTTTTTKTTTKTTTTTTTSTTKVIPPNKRQATDAETRKKSSNDIADQLAEVRKQRESQWRESGGKPQPAGNNSGRGFNAGYYNQLKEVRNKHNRDWHDTKLSQKRVWTIGDIENATKQGHIDSGKFNAGDSVAVRIGKEALELTNQFRKEQKLPPLAWHSALCTIGAQHSKNMAEHKVPFGHDGFQERIKQYPMAHRTAAENVAMSRGISDVAQTAVNGWINSPGHRKNLVSHSEFCGIGCYEGADGSWYLTQLFAG